MGGDRPHPLRPDQKLWRHRPRDHSGPRAVGGACGRNPIGIIVPCHRVLGSHGSLGGYSGAGGLVTKKQLLKLEGLP